jgi:hypothetical protein
MTLCSAYMFCDWNWIASIGLQFVTKTFSTNSLKAPFSPKSKNRNRNTVILSACYGITFIYRSWFLRITILNFYFCFEASTISFLLHLWRWFHWSWVDMLPFYEIWCTQNKSSQNCAHQLCHTCLYVHMSTSSSRTAEPTVMKCLPMGSLNENRPHVAVMVSVRRH